MAITVDGEKYSVVENLGFNHGIGVYAKMVKTSGGAQMAVRYPGTKAWRFWTAADRTQPLRDAIARGWHPGDPSGAVGQGPAKEPRE